ncbi:MAG: transcription termination factor NusA [Vampirovibrionales bacterium]
MMLKIGPALLENAELLERERGIPKDVTMDALKEAMVAAYKRYAKMENAEGIVCYLTERSGEIGIFQQQEIVEEIPEGLEEEGLLHTVMLLDEAKKLKPDVEVGDILEFEVTPNDFGRIAAQAAKQVITQRIREAEKLLILKEYEEKRGQVTTGIVQRIEGRNVVVNIGKSEAILTPREQLDGEYYRVGNKLRVYVADLRDTGRVPQIIVSQSHPQMVREVFELEVPEIEDGVVELKSIAREAGHRTKVAVHSNDPNVDPQGACIGGRGSRIQAIVNELKNEKIDIIRWSEDPVEFIANALAPAKQMTIYIDYTNPDYRSALVVVPDEQLSLAIGRGGQNVRLASKLTGYKLDIKPLSVIEQEGLPLHIYEQYYGAPQESVEGETVEADAAPAAVQAAAEAEGINETNQAEAEYQGVNTEAMDADEAIAVAEDAADELVEETVS